MAEDDTQHAGAQCIALLQDTPLKLAYLAEGNANVIYTVKSTDSKLRSHDHCCVMRLRKYLPFTRPAIEVLSAFKARIVPLYSEGHEHLLLEQALYKLDDKIQQQAALILRELERDERPNRPQKRRGAYLPVLSEEPHGILMPNLNRGKTMKLLEFKPKWLAQSPSVPHDAVRCRTCALNAVRRAEGKAPGRGDSGFCPFNLLSEDTAILRTILSNLISVTPDDSFIHDFVSKVQPALIHHQKLQQEHNQVGLDDFLNPEGKDLSLAMALRDCSVFLVVDDQRRILDVKFADLDLKTTGGGKLEHWASIEQSLLESGAYLTPDNICALSPQQ